MSPALNPAFTCVGPVEAPKQPPLGPSHSVLLTAEWGPTVEGRTSKGGHYRPSKRRQVAGRVARGQATLEASSPPATSRGPLSTPLALKSKRCPHTLGHVPPRWKVGLTDLWQAG